ncbi:MAG: hypothetical protein AB7O78_17750 [Thermoleophilia bacterium]
MDWFKVETRIATHEKVDDLTDGAFRALINIWAHAAQMENGGRVPPTAGRLIPRVTPARLRELEAKGFLHPNGTGWVIHDWDEHQADAEALRRIRESARNRRKAHRERKREAADET